MLDFIVVQELLECIVQRGSLVAVGVDELGAMVGDDLPDWYVPFGLVTDRLEQVDTAGSRPTVGLEPVEDVP